MAIKEDNTQVYVTLSKELVTKIDQDATKEMRTRSKQIAKIIKDYYENKGDWLYVYLFKRKGIARIHRWTL